MKRLTATTLFCLLFFSAFVAGKGPAETPGYPDSLRSVWLYTEGIKQNIIAGDTARARFSKRSATTRPMPRRGTNWPGTF